MLWENSVLVEQGWVCREVGCEFWWFLILVSLVGSAGWLEKTVGLFVIFS